MTLAKWWLDDSRLSPVHEPLIFHGDEESIVVHSKEIEKVEHHNYYIYGHRHIAVMHVLNECSTYVNLGDWISASTYAVYDGIKIELKNFTNKL